jgi:nucleotide-binding universal stress UspA family protein
VTRRIMIPLDRSPEAEAALAPAAAIARARGAEMHLVLVDGYPESPAAIEGHLDHRAYHDVRMHRLATALRRTPGLRVTLAIRPGETVATLAQYAMECGIDLIVMTTHGRTGWSRAWLGSVADELMHVTDIPLLLVPHSALPDPPTVRRVLVAVEGSGQGREAARTALDTFDGSAVTVTLGQVVSPVPANVDAHFPSALVLVDSESTAALLHEANRTLNELAAELRHERAAAIDVAVQLAPPVFPVPAVASALVELARRERADVVVLTTHERGWTRLLASSVADRVLNDTTCMLMIQHTVAQPVPAVAPAVNLALAGVAV